MALLVLDASVALAAIWPEERYSGAAQALMAAVASSGALVPAIWYSEVANSVVTRHRRGLIALDEIASLFRELASMPVLPDDLPFSESWGTTVALAVAHRLTSYDASYLELPRRTHLPLATFDQAWRRAAEAEAIPLANLVP